MILCCEGCLCTLDAEQHFWPLTIDTSSTFLVVTIKNVSRHCQMSWVARWQNCPQLRTPGLQQSYSMKSPENMLKSRCRRVEVTYIDTYQVSHSGNRTWYPEECLLINASECWEINLFSVLEWTARVQNRWIQGIRSGDGISEDQETIA